MVRTSTRLPTSGDAVMYEHQKDILKSAEKLMDAISNGERVVTVECEGEAQVLDRSIPRDNAFFLGAVAAHIFELTGIVETLDREVATLSRQLEIANKVGDDLSLLVAQKDLYPPDAEPPF